MNFHEEGVELFISSEKANLFYPPPFEEHQKPGTGVWTIDRIAAAEIMGLKDQSARLLLSSRDPQYLHVKDPVVYSPSSGGTILFFCTHPFSWSSSNSAYAVRTRGSGRFSEAVFDFFSRGTTWDVAVSRISDLLPLPEWREVWGGEDLSLVFYDGAECLRDHEQSTWGVKRPRGYSCEELGGLAVLPSESRPHRADFEIRTAFCIPVGNGMLPVCSHAADKRRSSGNLAAVPKGRFAASGHELPFLAGGVRGP